MTESEQLLSSLGRSGHRHQNPLHRDPRFKGRAGDPVQGPPLRPVSLQRSSVGSMHLPCARS